MENLKYTKTEDIQKFLKTLGYYWYGNFPKNSTQSFEDFPNGVYIAVCDKDNIVSALHLYVSDTSFMIENESSKKKFDCLDHSLMWQVFMVKRKGKKYSKMLYEQSLKTNVDIQQQYDKKISLLVKRAEKLAYERNLKISHANASMLNAATKLSKEEIEKINSEYEI